MKAFATWHSPSATVMPPSEEAGCETRTRERERVALGGLVAGAARAAFTWLLDQIN